MLKKIILAGVSIIAAVVGLLIYWSASNMGPLEDRPAGPGPVPLQSGSDEDVEMLQIGTIESGAAGELTVETGRTEDITFVRPIEDGVLRTSFAKRIRGTEGVFQVSKPRYELLYDNGSVIRLTAEVGSVPIDTTGGLPEAGALEDSVRIEVYDRSELTDVQAKPKPDELELLVELDRLDFEREFSRISSPGRVRITSDYLKLTGTDLAFQYDQINNRLQHLQVRRVEQLAVAGDALAPPTRDDDEPSPSDTHEDTARQPTGVSSADIGESSAAISESSAKIGPTYRLTIDNQVVVHSGQQRLAAETIEVMINLDFSSKALGTSQTSAAKDTTTAQAASKSADRPDKPVTWTRLTCQGPLQLTLAQRQPDKPTKRMEVTLWDCRPSCGKMNSSYCRPTE